MGRLEAADLRAVKLWAVSIMEDDCEVHGACRAGNNERRLEFWWGPRDEKA